MADTSSSRSSVDLAHFFRHMIDSLCSVFVVSGNLDFYNKGKNSTSCPLLLGLFLNEECVQTFWIGGLFVGIGGLFDFGANGQNP